MRFDRKSVLQFYGTALYLWLLVCVARTLMRDLWSLFMIERWEIVKMEVHNIVTAKHIWSSEIEVRQFDIVSFSRIESFSLVLFFILFLFGPFLLLQLFYNSCHLIDFLSHLIHFFHIQITEFRLFFNFSDIRRIRNRQIQLDFIIFLDCYTNHALIF